MDTETPPMQDHEFVGPQWVDMGGYGPTHQTPPLSDFAGYQYSPSSIMPIEPSYSMSMPQPYTAQHLIPLTMSSQWPSMLSTQPGFAPIPVVPMPMTPVASQLHHIPAPQISTSPTPRRTLTDAERRRMCLYHQDNPHIKQTEIGAMFGVERSTVSKVLRQKDKYLFPDDGRRTSSPVKKAKGKFPDIERALSNWVKNHLRQGGEINDTLIREKALFFANNVGSPDGHEKIMTDSWLDKFKQKNYLISSTGKKYSVNTNISPRKKSTIRSPGQVSPPTSPTLTTTPSPVTPKQTESSQDEEFGSELVEDSFGMSLPQESTPVVTSTLPRATSESTIIFTSNPFAPSEYAGLGVEAKRQRSQTLPVMASESSLLKTEYSESLSPTNAISQPKAIEEEAIDTPDVVNPPAMKRNRSNPEIITNLTAMKPPPLPKSKSISSPVTSPNSPTQDEARQALELVLSYFQSQSMNLPNSDYQTIKKLMEKLKISQGQVYIQPAKASSRVKSHPDRPRVSKKRSIHTL